MSQVPVRVLIVDDDEDDYILTRDLLSQIQGTKFALEWVDNYSSALEKMVQKQHDVYLLDYRLGDRNGLELLQAAIAAGCQAPIILLTGQGDRQIDVEAMKAGAADYLDKSQLRPYWLERSIRYAIERKRTEQKMQAQAALLNIATDAIFVRELGDGIVFWNQGAERLYGWKVAEILGKNTQELIYPPSAPPPSEAYETLTATGEWQGELEQVTKDGEKIIVQSRWNLVRDDDGQPKLILVVNTDITQKKQLEAQFLRAQRMESLGTLAGGIAHDLNNVLTPMLMVVQLLQLKLKDEQTQNWLSILETNVKRGAELVKQVLSFARSYEGKRIVLQVGHIVLEIRRIFQQTFPKSIEISTDISPDLWTVFGDATQLHQVLLNLCVNARDAMPYGGTLSITGENIWIDENYARLNIDAQPGPYAAITISDTGIGIPKEIIDKIFDPFFTTKEVGKGTGLGLSTVIGIVKSHKGFINVYTEVGKGTSFKVYLPATEVKEINSAREDKTEPFAGRGELILVADDEEAVCEITKLSLETCGYKVMVAANGIEAIGIYTQHQEEISLVLLDMMMPSIDGATTIRTLQKINPDILIIAVSGLASNQQIAELSGSSVKRFLLKPYTAQELLKNVAEVLDRHRKLTSV
ncbi:MAG: response regulator [Cyanosarcina radialis HA8281-LM2]|jgi:PAS domain S-box-containing protein|nr:response regulator [Cyanosarcina radialis HA8281-LM2]